MRHIEITFKTSKDRKFWKELHNGDKLLDEEREALLEDFRRASVGVQADGDELTAILISFKKSIPITSSPVQNWYGGTAKTIAHWFLDSKTKR
jgi:hypothetical protein